ncbi:MAG TPA: glycosyltransferase family 2 protein, partial [Chitinophagales bacterium]|nr:glycosyltransferase family 2 protein [Chitinophagales bacterium]
YPNVSVIHLEGGTTNKMHNSIPKSYYEYWTPKGFQLMVSNLLRIRKQYGVLWMMMIYIFYLIEIPVLFLAFLFSGKYTFLFLKDYIANVLSLSSLMPKIILNKPGFYKVI